MIRRHFIERTAWLPLAGAATAIIRGNGRGQKGAELSARLEKAVKDPVLRRELFKHPLQLASVELLHGGGNYLVRVRTTEGMEGISVAHKTAMKSAYPIFLNMVAPFLIGKDARDVEALVDAIYAKDLNYKWHGLPFFICIAAAEIAILDLLGKAVGKPLGELFGPIIQREVGYYPASSNRENEPDAEIAHLQKLVENIGSRAFKFRLGGRMKYDDASNRRDRLLVPLLRKSFGPQYVIYGDGNSSFDAAMAIRTGRLLEDHGIAVFEEPVPFDHYEETKQVADALHIPIAGGEIEMSLRQFRYLIERDVLQVVQPDLLYFGGMVRSLRVARLAEACGKFCNPHMSGGGLGWLYVLHFASLVPNAGPFQEYKGHDAGLPVSCSTSTLRCTQGKIKVPTGPGLGIQIDPDFISRASSVTL